MFGEGSSIRRLRLWSSPLAVKAYRLARRAAERLGLQVVLKTYYSPIPDLANLPDGVWDERDPLRGIDLDLDAQMSFVESELSGHVKQLAWGNDVAPQHSYEPNSHSYPLPDARILYAMIRHLRPQLILELGSGQTTRVMAQAARENARDGVATRLRALDPFPTAVDDSLPGVTELLRAKAQDVPDEVFAELQAGDVLFVDTTHTVKIASDVNHIILRVLPLLNEGVLVHVHDIFLPYEYPRFFFADYALYWAEQYLLQAFLAFNSSFEVVCAVHALGRERAARMAAAGALTAGEIGSSFWIRRVAAAG
ncbi:MAG: class I SAM-dependent methyltransferase [Solirubrobacteraceae bacterium]